MWTAAYLLASVIHLVNLYYICLGDPVIMCYFPSTARLRTNIAKFEIKDIDFTLCTHYIYDHAIFDGTTSTLVARDPAVEEGPSGLYREFTNAKIKLPSIKTLLFVGTNTQYMQCLRVGTNTTHLNEFVTSAVVLLRMYGFDGLVVRCLSTSVGQKIALANMLKALREKFHETATNGKLILTVSATGLEDTIRTGYDVDVLAKTVDYVIIDTHELYFAAMARAHFATPLYPMTVNDPFNVLCMNVSLSAWSSKGMPYGKIVVGFTGVGRLLELVNKSSYEPGAPVTQAQYRGPLYNIKNGLAYPEICEVRPKANTYFDDLQKTPYLVQNQSWVGYDDPVSLQLKIKWLKQFDVAGFMFSGLDEDDFTGTKCGEGQYPLLAAMRNATIETWPSVTLVSPEGDPFTIISPSVTGPYHREDINIIRYSPYGLLLIPLLLLVLVALLFLCRRNRPQPAE